MQIQVNTDDNAEGSDALICHVEDTVRATLGHFASQITRVEVHLGDENAAKSDGVDKRCLMEARPPRHQPVTVSHHAATLPEAYGGAAKKLKALLGTTFGRRKDAKGAASIRDNDLR